MASAVIRLSVQSESKALCMFMSCQGFVCVCVLVPVWDSEQSEMHFLLFSGVKM